MHHNIPSYGATSSKNWKKAGWFFLGVFEPEVVSDAGLFVDRNHAYTLQVVWSAYTQLRYAHKINDVTTAVLRQMEPEKEKWWRRCGIASKQWFQGCKQTVVTLLSR
jgi:hypothetical protein